MPKKPKKPLTVKVDLDFHDDFSLRQEADITAKVLREQGLVIHFALQVDYLRVAETTQSDVMEGLVSHLNGVIPGSITFGLPQICFVEPKTS